MKTRISIGEKYRPAMEIKDQTEADRYFETCVLHNMKFGTTRAEAERVERINLGYFAGYYDHETRLRVERLYRCAHTIFGKAIYGIPPAQEALNAGASAARGVT